MNKPIKIVVYNCDSTVDLDRGVIEPLFDGLYVEFEMVSFPVQRMSTQIATLDSKPPSDYIAVIAQHANESRLSINDQGGGIGLGKLFKSLELNSNHHVLVIILYDTSTQYYVDGPLLSPTIYNKLYSQFTEGQLNGERGFVFSWNDVPTEEHKAAMTSNIDQFPHQGQSYKNFDAIVISREMLNASSQNYGERKSSQISGEKKSRQNHGEVVSVLEAFSSVKSTLISPFQAFLQWTRRLTDADQVWWEAKVSDGKIVGWIGEPLLPGKDISSEEYIFLKTRIEEISNAKRVKFRTEGGLIKEMLMAPNQGCFSIT